MYLKGYELMIGLCRAAHGARLTWLAAATAFCILLSGCSSVRSGTKQYQMGERAELGSVVYTLLEAHWKTQLGEAPSVRMPRDRFLLLRLSVTNGGAKEVAVPLMALIAPGGETYNELTEGGEVPDWLGVLRHVKPVETVTGWVVFDAPRGNYKLRVSDDAFDPEAVKTALIEVPLRFEAPGDLLPESQPAR
jgi:hypothetical protein